jgi:transposase
MNLSKKSKVYVYKQFVDMRKSYDGLYGIIRSYANPLSGDVYLFISKDRTRVKSMFWDGTGINIWMKRLERGQFADVFDRIEMSISELYLFFEGSGAVIKKISMDDMTRKYVA